MTRGLRNNNPLNIRHSRTIWQGMCGKQSDPDFTQFKTMAYGVRAAFKTLQTYMTTHNLNTIEGIISRWATPNENDTEKYIKVVSSRSGIARDKVISFDDKETMIAIVKAMTYMENGEEVAESDIRDGYELV